MPKRKCECKRLREELQWHRDREERLREVLRDLVEIEDGRRALSRERGRAIMDARVLLHLAAGEKP